MLPELPVLEEIVETEEVEQFESHVEPFIFQSYAQLTGAGNNGGTYLAVNILTEIFHFKKNVEIKRAFFSIREHTINFIPFFILYCSLIVYS